jgi:NTE family protein
VLKLPRADFVALAEQHPAVLKPIAVTLARRLADTLAGGERPRLSRPRTLAVIGAGTSPVPEEFRAGLTGALSREAKILVVDAKTLAAVFPGMRDLESEAVTSWLNLQEARYDYLLYFADAELTPFSRKAIRQADQVILVALHQGRADRADLKPNALESFAFEIHSPPARRLVLLHDARAPISGTSGWLDQRPVALHHHLVIGEDADYDRLARFISSRAIGFVASGGGALCAAHIGAYKALTNAGLSFDLLGGTSGGGAMAAAFAMGASPEDVSARTADIFLNARALRRLTWPRYSLLDHTIFDRMLKLHYGEAEIEDLWTPYFAVSTCLANNALCPSRGGPCGRPCARQAPFPVCCLPSITRTGACWSTAQCSTMCR